jgi:small subunit ribosomal protein S3
LDGEAHGLLPKPIMAIFLSKTKGFVSTSTRNLTVTLHSARPGVVIGPRGGEVDRLREELEELTGRKMGVNVIEIKEPDLDATLVAEAIAEQLSKRASFRRTMKQFCESAMNAGAKGVKIICAGRLAGSEMARRETQKLGSIPLQTLDANVDYATATSRTTYGTIGVKAWIYKGKFGEEIEPRQTRRRRQPRRTDTGPRVRIKHRTAPVKDQTSDKEADVVAPPEKTIPSEQNTVEQSQDSPTLADKA